MANSALGELIDLGKWQQMQDNFSIVAGVGLRTLTSDGAPAVKPSGEPRICTLNKESHLHDALCGECLPTFLGGTGVVDRNLSFNCHAHLHNFIVPLKVDTGKIVGYVIVGPMSLVARKPKEEYRGLADRLGVELDELWEALHDVRVISFQRAQGMTELIRLVGDYVLGMAARRVSFQQQLQELAAADTPNVSELLKSFLEVAVQMSGADVASIMLLKGDSKELFIRASKGIPDEIARNARVKLGEGISGTAAKENTPFLIDDNVQDNRIKTYLRRPYIRSSMVLPINVENSVLGVMNLGALDSSPVRFNAGNLQSMNQLISLAASALRTPKR